ncbi:unnamed protein product [Arabidopsis halleri]
MSNGFLKVITAVAFALDNVDDDDDGCVDEVHLCFSISDFPLY